MLVEVVMTSFTTRGHCFVLEELDVQVFKVF